MMFWEKYKRKNNIMDYEDYAKKYNIIISRDLETMLDRILFNIDDRTEFEFIYINDGKFQYYRTIKDNLEKFMSDALNRKISISFRDNSTMIVFLG